MLADIIAGGQGSAVSQEENQAIIHGQEILQQLLNNFFTNLTPPSCSTSGAETE